MYRLGVAKSEGEEWADWRRSVFGEPYLVWHDGADFGELLRRARSSDIEARRVHAMLALGLDEADPLAANSIAVLAEGGAVPTDAEALLSDALVAAEATPNRFLTALARALRAVTGDETWTTPLILRVLAEAPDWSSRIDAALGLRHVDPTPEVLDALTRALTDPEYLVRYHAAETMLRHAYRTDVEISGRRALFAKLRNSEQDGPADWQDMAQTLAAECIPRIERERQRGATMADAVDRFDRVGWVERVERVERIEPVELVESAGSVESVEPE